jgi:hypothetical protein
VVRSLRIESIIWRTTASAGLGFSVADAAERGRIAINQIPTTISIAMRAAFERASGAIRNRGLFS